MPIDRFIRTHQRKQGYAAANVEHENSHMAFGERNRHLNRVQRSLCQNLADNPLCHPNWRDVLVNSWIPWLDANELYTLTPGRVRILGSVRRQAAAIADGRQQPMLIGPAHWTAASDREFRARQAKLRDERRPDWMQDSSKLPKAPPTRRSA
jgi:hypothetical protein